MKNEYLIRWSKVSPEKRMDWLANALEFAREGQRARQRLKGKKKASR